MKYVIPMKCKAIQDIIRSKASWDASEEELANVMEHTYVCHKCLNASRNHPKECDIQQLEQLGNKYISILNNNKLMRRIRKVPGVKEKIERLIYRIQARVVINKLLESN